MLSRVRFATSAGVSTSSARPGPDRRSTRAEPHARRPRSACRRALPGDAEARARTRPAGAASSAFVPPSWARPMTTARAARPPAGRRSPRCQQRQVAGQVEHGVRRRVELGAGVDAGPRSRAGRRRRAGRPRARRRGAPRSGSERGQRHGAQRGRPRGGRDVRPACASISSRALGRVDRGASRLLASSSRFRGIRMCIRRRSYSPVHCRRDHARLQGLGRAVRARRAARLRAGSRAPRLRQRRRLRPLPAVPPHRRPRAGRAALAGRAGGAQRARPHRHQRHHADAAHASRRWSPRRSPPSACSRRGRVFLGVGTGESMNEVPALGIEWPGFAERLARLEEAVTLIRRLWREERVTFEGEYYRTLRATIYDRPEMPPPILIAAAGRRRRASPGAPATATSPPAASRPSCTPRSCCRRSSRARARRAATPRRRSGCSRSRSPTTTTIERAVAATAGSGPPLALPAEGKQGVDDPLELERLGRRGPRCRRSRFIVTGDPAEVVEKVRAVRRDGLPPPRLPQPGGGPGGASSSASRPRSSPRCARPTADAASAAAPARRSPGSASWSVPYCCRTTRS